jgi:hypothetical protein
MKNNCIILTNNENTILNIFMHIFILCIILTLFFFLVVSKLERKNLDEQVKNFISIGISSSNITRNEQGSLLTRQLAKLYDKPNEADKIYNSSLLNYSLFVISIFIICFIAISLSLKYSAKKCTNFTSLLIENILLFICVGIIEFIFFINIAINYIPVKPSVIAEMINKRF